MKQSHLKVFALVLTAASTGAFAQQPESKGEVLLLLTLNHIRTVAVGSLILEKRDRDAGAAARAHDVPTNIASDRGGDARQATAKYKQESEAWSEQRRHERAVTSRLVTRVRDEEALLQQSIQPTVAALISEGFCKSPGRASQTASKFFMTTDANEIFANDLALSLDTEFVLRSPIYLRREYALFEKFATVLRDACADLEKASSQN